ncbi:MAG: response regulator transcription factor [Myxococcota bacterium]
MRLVPTAWYAPILAFAFLSLGIWVGTRFRRTVVGAFETNTAAIASLGITERELEVLGLIAVGKTNKEIASRLFVSANTVKTHVTHVYQKLGVSRRTQAVLKARELRLIP